MSRRSFALMLSLSLTAMPLDAQRGAPAGGGRGNQPPAAAQGNVPADAPFDPTGYWVSIVSDEWRYRMLTPAKGNVDYVPVNQEGRRVAQEWDPTYLLQPWVRTSQFKKQPDAKGWNPTPCSAR